MINDSPHFSPKATVWVNANAGSGKTYTLIERIVSLLLHGVTPKNILCLTYTRVAASEMTSKLYQTLDKFAKTKRTQLTRDLQTYITPVTPEISTKAQQLYLTLLEQKPSIQIMTVHAFCQSILNTFPQEAQLMPAFALTTPGSKRILLQESMGLLFKAAETNTALAQGIAMLIKDIKNYTQFIDFFAQPLNITHIPEPHAEVSVLGDMPNLSPIITQLQQNEAPHDLIHTLQTVQNKPITKNILEQYLHIFLTDKDTPRKKLPEQFSVFSSHKTLKSFFNKEKERLYERLQQQDWAKVQRVSRAASFVLTTYQHIYSQQKKQHNVLEYADLLYYVRDMFSHINLTWIFYKLDQRIDHVLIDEAQDMSDIQWTIVQKLTADYYTTIHDIPKTLFVVGDVKQSIYSFQGAHPEIFISEKKRVQKIIAPLEQEIGKPLFFEMPKNTTYRCPKNILRVVDNLRQYAPMEQVGTKVPNNPHSCDPHQWVEGNENGKVSLWLLPKKMTATEKRQQISKRIIRFLSLAVGRLMVPSTGQPLRLNDVMILYQTRTALGPLIHDLKAAGIPVPVADRFFLNDQPIVHEILALAKFLYDPLDDLNTAIVVKSCPIGLTDNDLMALKKPFIHALRTEYGAIHNWLIQLHTRTPFNFFKNLFTMPCPAAHSVEEAFIHVYGQEGQWVMDELLSYVYRFEQENTPSLLLCIESLSKDTIEINRTHTGKTTDQLTLSTIHGAKGKEAPFVCILDTDHTPHNLDHFTLLEPEEPEDPTYFYIPLRTEAVKQSITAHTKQKQYLEHNRLLYVASTRAKDCLIYVGKPSQKEDVWVSHIIHTMKDIGARKTYLGYTYGYMVQPNIKKQKTKKPEKNALLSPSNEWVYTPLSLPVHITLPKQSNEAQKRGILIHKILQMWPQWPEQNRKKWATKYEQSHTSENLVPHIIHMWEHIAQFTHNAQCMFEPEYKNKTGQFMRPDVVCIHNNQVTFIDYKTDVRIPHTPNNIPLQYKKQFQRYTKLLETVYSKPVQGVLLYVQEARLWVWKNRTFINDTTYVD